MIRHHRAVRPDRRPGSR